MDSYSLEFEEEFCNMVKKKIGLEERTKILNSCQNFLPTSFFASRTPAFEAIIRAPFAKLKEAKNYIDAVSMKQMKTECFDPAHKNRSQINDLYISLYNAFDSTARAEKNKISMRVRIVEESGFTVCPYCNRDYINCRGKNVSGAQLDHFFSRSEYPIFAVSLYNLVPTCANCNRVKSAQDVKFASPFDQTIDWENGITFAYSPEGSDRIKIVIETSAEEIKNNISKMRIEEAYEIHGLEIKDIEDKLRAYSESQKQEIREILYKMNISDEEIKRIIFGPKITPGDMRKKPLGKMISDVHRKLKIY